MKPLFSRKIITYVVVSLLFSRNNTYFEKPLKFFQIIIYFHVKNQLYLSHNIFNILSASSKSNGVDVSSSSSGDSEISVWNVYYGIV